ncbi:hypothetical protein MXB_507 [Myxobolus squamalis]|nr:hypothetical protein MXB_507 [Myxobolus squamalis]
MIEGVQDVDNQEILDVILLFLPTTKKDSFGKQIRIGSNDIKILQEKIRKIKNRMVENDDSSNVLNLLKIKEDTIKWKDGLNQALIYIQNYMSLNQGKNVSLEDVCKILGLDTSLISISQEN